MIRYIYCEWVPHGMMWKCSHCGRVKSKRTQRECPALSSRIADEPEPPPRTRGVGDVLTELVKPYAWLVWFRSGPCKCPEHAATLNEWGPAVTRERVDEVVGWMTQGLELIPFAAFEARRLVLTACDVVEGDR